MTDKNKTLEEEQIIFDYTEWQREHFSGMSIEEITEAAAAATENYIPPNNVKII